jgi:hypothetical protein
LNQKSMSVFHKLTLTWMQLMNGTITAEEYKILQWNLIYNYQKEMKDE